MRGALLMALVLAGLSGAAFAKPNQLTEKQMSRVAGGYVFVPGQPFDPRPIQPVGPPVIQPGGPILISCTVGVGCTTRHYP